MIDGINFVLKPIQTIFELLAICMKHGVMLEIYPLASTYITCLEDDTYKLCLSFLFLFTICMIMIKEIEY